MSSPQEQFAAAVRSTQAQAADAVETWTKITQEAFGKIGDAPAKAPQPDQVIDQVFDFAEKMLEGQREFAHKMLGMSEKVGAVKCGAPNHAASPRRVKSTGRARPKISTAIPNSKVQRPS